MTEKAILRLGAVLLIGGTILNILFNAVQPPISDYGDTVEVFTALAAVPLWRVSRVGILVAGLISVGGMLTFAYSQRGGAARYPALLVSGNAIVGVGILCMMMALDLAQHEMALFLLGVPQDEANAVFWASQALHSASFMVFTISLIVIGGLLQTLLGWTIFIGKEYPQWLGWTFSLGGAAIFISSAIQAVAGPSTLLMNTLIPFFGLTTTISGLALGFFMGRKARSV